MPGPDGLPGPRSLRLVPRPDPPRGDRPRRRAAVAEGAGLLGSESFTIARGHFGVLQYWRSFDDLDAWSHRPPHSEWWREAVDRMRRKQDLGVYHEVFRVPAANLESIYLDCEPAGLARFGKLGEPVGPMTTARGRLGMMRPQ